ncbi:MAG: ABC transporter substrate-binding protein [Rhodospirillaceae bacterium]|jgi:peptide/nickel transport system substrate-binding protein|nr:ABC transporter substrate-binding protein [Rhodospirillaceae bacterium]MBT5240937.1 ABC transporter substrate-binding protein [Rhodospirillaceae bacterium]MBT5564553.1 ABC transporter substrate-binding protein [Rhodospirillaceae bacterium]MBT6090888.1 ABC transporter substrate-binding protein [Rhodospirillaceae bacterium]MBT7450896.1 ABC transporter substrate-binding protein [Rhodospirillaceae bacterium]
MALFFRQCFTAALALAVTLSTPTWGADPTILRVGIGGLPTQKGNAFSNIQSPSILVTGGVFDGLTRLAKDGAIEPWLATSWEALDDLTWRFTLRDDVVFSNGKPFDAAAVAHTANYLSGSGPQLEGLRRDFRFLSGATVVDSHTVDIVTKVPVPMLPRYASVLLIVEPGAWQSMGVEKFSLTPVGTGPLVVESWEPGRAITRANRLSWRPMQIDGVDFIVLPDPSSRVQAVLSGGLDAAYQTAPEDFDVLQKAGGHVVSIKDGSVFSIMLQFGQDRETPLNDIRVRHALNYAIDKQTIADVLLGGLTSVASQPAVREAYGFDPTLSPYAYDPERARQLLSDAGYPDGFTMSLETSGGGTNGRSVVQRVADDLGRVGIQMDIQQKPVMSFLLDFVRGRIEADSFTLQWGAYPILDSIQMTNINSCRKSQPWYCDDDIQPVIEAAWTETDPQQALDLRRQVMRHYHEDAPGIFLHENIGFIGLSPRTQGFDQTFGYVSYESVRLH